MSDKCFLDTNIIIYAHTDLDLRKQKVAQHIIASESTSLSTQVLQGTDNILFKKFQFVWPDIQIVLTEATNNKENSRSALHFRVAGLSSLQPFLHSRQGIATFFAHRKAGSGRPTDCGARTRRKPR